MFGNLANYGAPLSQDTLYPCLSWRYSPARMCSNSLLAFEESSLLIISGTADASWQCINGDGRKLFSRSGQLLRSSLGSDFWDIIIRRCFWIEEFSGAYIWISSIAEIRISGWDSYLEIVECYGPGLMLY